MYTIKKINWEAAAECNLCGAEGRWVKLKNGAEGDICLSCLQDRMTIPGKQRLRIKENDGHTSIYMDYLRTDTPLFITHIVRSHTYAVTVYVPSHRDYFSVISGFSSKLKARKALRELSAYDREFENFFSLGHKQIESLRLIAADVKKTFS